MVKRNDQCWCGSERLYRHCHFDIDEAADETKYKASQAVYSRNWALTSKHHYENGYYHRLAEQLLPHSPKRILDIGCGSGHGLMALMEVLGEKIQIVALDENSSCLDQSANNLRSIDVHPTVLKRIDTSLIEGSFVSQTTPLEKLPNEPCVLIQSDICDDPTMLTALINSGQFDAITIWLTGVHMLRQNNILVKSADITSDAEHRLYVQNNAYEWADLLLQSSGILQVADRRVAPTDQIYIDDIRNSHTEQAEPTTLTVIDVTYQIYEEPKKSGTPMILTLGTSGIIPNSNQLSIVSVISKKS